MSTLAGSGTSGNWNIDIENEESIQYGYEWSITVSHTQCYFQSPINCIQDIDRLIEHFSDMKCDNTFFKLGVANDLELLLGKVNMNLLIRMCRSSGNTPDVFPWMLECVLNADEILSLLQALHEAVREAQLPE